MYPRALLTCLFAGIALAIACGHDDAPAAADRSSDDASITDASGSWALPDAPVTFDSGSGIEVCGTGTCRNPDLCCPPCAELNWPERCESSRFCSEDMQSCEAARRLDAGGD